MFDQCAKFQVKIRTASDRKHKFPDTCHGARPFTHSLNENRTRTLVAVPENRDLKFSTGSFLRHGITDFVELGLKLKPKIFTFE